ncbi:Large exoprotein involved in heme utilization or adhesion (plasmid) [Nostoc flagelliforme CCNUN1]|uniref:Large exoprotein involved in heme utilization or adhesion n=1 Tax=Nostoc flagelliforme CCNUN1 TaxID=2038116 RepID=A0A2K8T767_9NOSO|nr:filamentous hemagglutinin N-terminal domain-containing protein [Nostoc flagelliforme]AUB43537.1 Large exoprotein involved in heme utilization or adhesion [Nostoc flagelliforme CCNUN1]
MIFQITIKSANSQIIPDALTINSQVTINGDITTITGGSQAGSNLFHSFGQFSLPTGTQAHFKNALDINNILVRVTGQSPSSIDGLIQANGTANLFFINPNGISFGSNASLNIGGSFIASTANGIEFADGTYFDTQQTSPTQGLLTVAIPIGLRFSNRPASILVSGDGQGARTGSDLIDTTSGLRVQPNQTLALVGGDMALTGATIKTAGGRIELGSVSGEGFVNLTSANKGWVLGYSNIKTFGDIQLSDAAVVDASGSGGGDIRVNSRNLSLTGGSQLEASTLGTEAGGTIEVNSADSLTLLGAPGSDLFLNTTIAAEVYEGATGTGGSININTGRLLLADEGQISAGTSGIGNSGSIEISARDIEVVGKSVITDSPFGSSIATVVEPGGFGIGGNISINTERLTIRDGGAVSVSTYSQGNGGNLAIKASDSIVVTGQLPGYGTLSTSRISALTWGSGNAGNIRVEAGRLSLQDGARISVSSEFPSVDIPIENPGTGNAGSLQIDANKVDLASQSSISAATFGGEGGNIFLTSNNLILHNSSINTNAFNAGNSGNINVDTDALVLQNSNITANAFEGQGGNIKINTQGLFVSSDSKVTATSEKGVDGTVQINTPQLDLVNSDIKSSYFQDHLVFNACSPNSLGLPNNLSISGRGGLPVNLDDLFTTTLGLTDPSSPIPSQQLPQSTQTNNTENIVVAQGWRNNGDGTVSFVITPGPTDEMGAYTSPLRSSCIKRVPDVGG